MNGIKMRSYWLDFGTPKHEARCRTCDRYVKRPEKRLQYERILELGRDNTSMLGKTRYYCCPCAIKFLDEKIEEINKHIEKRKKYYKYGKIKKDKAYLEDIREQIIDYLSHKDAS